MVSLARLFVNACIFGAFGLFGIVLCAFLGHIYEDEPAYHDVRFADSRGLDPSDFPRTNPVMSMPSFGGEELQRSARETRVWTCVLLAGVPMCLVFGFCRQSLQDDFIRHCGLNG